MIDSIKFTRSSADLYWGILFGIGAYSVAIANIALAFATLWLIYERQTLVRSLRTSLGKIFLAYWGWLTILSGIYFWGGYNPELNIALDDFRPWAKLGLIGFFALTIKAPKSFILGVGLASTVCLFSIALTHLHSFDLSIKDLLSQRQGYGRNPNMWAFLSAISMVFSLSTLFIRSRISLRLFAVFGFLISTFLLISTGSKNGFIAATVACLLLVTLKTNRRDIMAIGVLVAVAIGTQVPQVHSRFAEIYDQVTISKNIEDRPRVQLAKVGIAKIAEQPLIGHGPKSIYSLVSNYDDYNYPAAYPSLHNWWLDAAVEGGVLLSLILLIICVAPIYLSRKVSRDSATSTGIALMTLFICFSLFDSFYTQSWRLCAIVLIPLYCQLNYLARQAQVTIKQQL